MAITYDPGKNDKNIALRGIALSLACGRRTKRNPERAGRDNPVWTDETFKRARPAREILPKLFGGRTAEKMLRPRGRPKTGNARVAISLRLPPETLASWKATGPGWQTRMAEKLKRAV